MSEVPVQDEADLEEGLYSSRKNTENDNASKSTNQTLPNSALFHIAQQGIVRTPCGHIFHKQCLANWIVCRWQISPKVTSADVDNEDTQEEILGRRAKQTQCPLCRKDMIPLTRGKIPHIGGRISQCCSEASINWTFFTGSFLVLVCFFV